MRPAMMRIPALAQMQRWASRCAAVVALAVLTPALYCPVAMGIDIPSGDSQSFVRMALRRSATSAILRESVSLGHAVHVFPVDASVKALIVNVANAAHVRITRPDGSHVSSSDGGVEAIRDGNVAMVSIDLPIVGNWSIAVTALRPYKVAVDGLSPIALAQFRFLEPRGRPGHEGLFSMNGMPRSVAPVAVMARLAGPDTLTEVSFEFRADSGTGLGSIELVEHSAGSRAYYGTATPPAGSFRPYVRGKDAGGFAVQRTLDLPFTSSHVIVQYEARDALVQPTPLTFTVTNHGGPDTFDLAATVSNATIDSVVPSSVKLGTGEVATVRVRVSPAHPADFERYLAATLVASGRMYAQKNSGTFRGAADLRSVRYTDVDGDGVSQPLTDGVLVLRYMFGFRGTTLVAGAVAPGAVRSSPTAVEGHIGSALPFLDIDGDGVAQPLTDGLLILRYLFGFRGAVLTNGAIGAGATRNAAQIETYISGL